jgi:hypothetical protein
MNQLDAANNAVQVLKSAFQKRENIMNGFLGQLTQLKVELNKKIDRISLVKDTIHNEKLTLNHLEYNLRKKCDKYSKEIKRIENFKGDLIDAEAWMEGMVHDLHCPPFYIKAIVIGRCNAKNAQKRISCIPSRQYGAGASGAY